MLRDPVFHPPFNIVRASHVELGVADIARSRAFYVDCLGYIVSDEDKDALYLRGLGRYAAAAEAETAADIIEEGRFDWLR